MEEDIQQRYMELQMLNQQIKQIQQQAEALGQQAVELSSVSQSLDEFKDVKPGTEILVQINNGIFAKASIQDTKKLIVNIGANVAVKKDVSSTRELIDEQIIEIKKLEEKKVKEMEQMFSKIGVLEKELSEGLSKKE